MLTTARLLLRPTRTTDLDDLAPMYADPEVMRFIFDGSVRDRQQTAEHLALLERTWDEHGFGIFTVTVRATSQVAGWVGLAIPRFLPEVLPAVEIGWRLARPYWGAGIATEGAVAALRFGMVDRALDRVISIRHPDNYASARVMDKLGLQFDRRTTVPEVGRPVVVHAITRPQYLAAAATTPQRP